MTPWEVIGTLAVLSGAESKEDGWRRGFCVGVSWSCRDPETARRVIEWVDASDEIAASATPEEMASGH